MALSGACWSQLKNLTKGELRNALRQDGYFEDEAEGSSTIFFKPGDPPRRVAIHMHKRSDTMGRELLKKQIAATGWTEADLRRLKLIK